jgi:hypothetical protein
MTAQFTFSRNPKPISGAAIAGVILDTLSCRLDGVAALGCILFDKTAWVATEVVRSVILAGWPSVLAYLCEDSRVMQHVLQILAGIWPLLCFLAN